MASSAALFVWAYVCVCVTQLSRQTAMLLRFFMWHKMCDRCKSCASAVAVADIGSGSSSSRGSGRGTAVDVSQCLLIFLFYFYTNHVVQPTKNTYSHTHTNRSKVGWLARTLSWFVETTVNLCFEFAASLRSARRWLTLLMCVIVGGWLMLLLLLFLLLLLLLVLCVRASTYI